MGALLRQPRGFEGLLPRNEHLQADYRFALKSPDIADGRRVIEPARKPSSLHEFDNDAVTGIAPLLRRVLEALPRGQPSSPELEPPLKAPGPVALGHRWQRGSVQLDLGMQTIQEPAAQVAHLRCSLRERRGCFEPSRSRSNSVSLNRSKRSRTTSTFSCDIAYSDSPAGSRAARWCRRATRCTSLRESGSRARLWRRRACRSPSCGRAGAASRRSGRRRRADRELGAEVGECAEQSGPPAADSVVTVVATLHPGQDWEGPPPRRRAARAERQGRGVEGLKPRRVRSRFSCDIAYSDCPTASRASCLVW